MPPPKARIYFLSALSRFGSTALVFATTVLTARALGPAGRGTFAALTTTVALISQVSGLGVSSAVMVEISRRPWRIEKLAPVALAISGVLGLGGGLLWLLLFGRASWLAPGTNWLILFWPSVQLISLTATAMLLARRRFIWFNGLDVGARLVTLCGVSFLSISAAVEVRPYLLAIFFVESAVAIIAGAVLMQSSRLRFRSAKAVASRVMSTGRRVYLLLLLPAILIRSDVLILSALRPAAEVGLYSIAAQVVALFLIVPQSIGQVLFPLLSRSHSDAEETRRTVAIAFWLMIAAAIALVGISPIILGVMFGSDFVGAYPFLLVLLPGGVALGVQTVAVQYFNVRGFPVFLVRYWALVVIGNVLVNFLLIPRFGAMAAACSSSLAYALIAFLVTRRLSRETSTQLRGLISLEPMFAAIRLAMPSRF